jgi:alpha-beta hydrolase superfamily lysophospholipase
MGSFLARLYAARFGARLDGLILSGTAGRNPAASGGRLLARAIARGKGPKYVSKTLYELSDGRYAKAFPEDGAAGWLSRDPEARAAYLEDPYCTFPFTASAYGELFAMLEECNSGRWYGQMPKQLPVLLLSGDRDPVGEMGKGPLQVYDGLTAAGVLDVRRLIYPEGRHEMLHETNRQEVYGDILAWIQDILSRKAQENG